MKRLVALGLLVLTSCAYSYGERRGGKLPQHTFDGVGWDGDLAYGAAMAKATAARNVVEDPDYVDMNCSMYGLKVLAAAAGGALTGWAASEGKSGVALGIGVGTLGVAVIPNCFSTIGYHDRRPARRPARDTIREELFNRPTPKATQPADEPDDRADDDAPDAGAAPPPPPPPQRPAQNQVRDRE